MTAELNQAPEKSVLGRPSAVVDSSKESQAPRQNSLRWGPLLAIGLAAFLVEVPFFFLGTPSGHDVEFHTYSWLEVLSQWKHGILYPRWAAWAHFGYGEPRFVFYPPASWMLGALTSLVFPWTLATSIYIWIALVAAGASMFVLARRWLDRRSAMFAAVLYAVNPYHLVIVYWRSAFAELLAACLIPLLLLFVVEAAEGRRRILPLGLVMAAAWLTNAPAAVMIHYSLALLIVFFAWRKRSSRLLFVGAAAIAIGACLAAFYLLPAIYEQKWVTISEAVGAGSRPQDNFLFVHTTDADHDAFNRVISWVAVLEMGLIALSFAAGKLWRRRDELSKVLPVWTVGCSILMFPVTLFLWDVLPKMRFMQFPWRWLLCLSMIFATVLTMGLRRWWWRGAGCALCLLVMILAWNRVQAPWWDNTADLREMQDNMSDHIGYEGTDEYTPVGAEPSAIDKTARDVTVDGPARAAIRVQRWDAESKTFTAEMSAPDQLALRLFPYPAWKTEVNGRGVQTGIRPRTGQMLVPVEAGMNRVQITFVRTWDRRIGGWISGITVLALIGWTIRTKRVQAVAS
ncbi:MAG: 6-pyruvoyl-tetrahydropterin synthase-related protein [Candidatus Sulfotelmatobacter sp.]